MPSTLTVSYKETMNSSNNAPHIEFISDRCEYNYVSSVTKASYGQIIPPPSLSLSLSLSLPSLFLSPFIPFSPLFFSHPPLSPSLPPSFSPSPSVPLSLPTPLSLPSFGTKFDLAQAYTCPMYVISLEGREVFKAAKTRYLA